MLVKQQPQISEKELAEFFPEADLILLEGFKYSTYPKIEIIRKGNSAESVCNPEKLMAIATNLDAEERDALSVLENVPFFELDNAECIAAKVVENAGDGDIILMHDYYDTSVTAALEVVDVLQKRGFQFVTVEEILFD